MSECEDDPWTIGDWHFLNTTAVRLDEVNPSIQVEACERGFLVVWDGDTLAFTDRVEAAEWLLGWLGFDDEIVESVLDILEGQWDPDELYDILSDCVAGVDYDELEDTGCQGVLDVAEAAQAYVEAEGGVEVWAELCEAVKKWRGIK